jgi:histidinol phosphatase-like enzyme (inositol monophosphatase family)
MDKNLADGFLDFSEVLADTSRTILLNAIRYSHEIDIKADASFVTATDRAIEMRLREMIEAKYPHHGILGEEFGAISLDKEFVWVIDPIDGTAPFIAGIPVYGTLISVARNGKPWTGLMDFPATSERLTGIAGMCAHHNDRAIRCRPLVELENAFVTSSNPGFMTEVELKSLAKLNQAARYTQYGGSCYAYGCLARGQTDIAVDAGFNTYDVFAPIAIIEGAGGVVSDWNGQSITLDWEGQIIAAGDSEIHAQAIELFNN